VGVTQHPAAYRQHHAAVAGYQRGERPFVPVAHKTRQQNGVGLGSRNGPGHQPAEVLQQWFGAGGHDRDPRNPK
jgi:hypothetical protein